jgi:hypothetical protein
MYPLYAHYESKDPRYSFTLDYYKYRLIPCEPKGPYVTDANEDGVVARYDFLCAYPSFSVDIVSNESLFESKYDNMLGGGCSKVKDIKKYALYACTGSGIADEFLKYFPK